MTQASGKPACAWNDPVARDALVSRLVNDALTVLDAVDGVELDDAQQQLVGLLALVAGQDVEVGDEEGTWRIERNVAKHRVISTVDPETRHMHKLRSSYRDGYKAHIAVETDTGLITACDLTPANEGGGPTGIALLAAEEAGLDVLADSAYGSGESLASLAEAEHRILIKPWPLARNPKLGDDQFRRDDFVIDYAARTLTCPNGITTHITAKRQRHVRNEVSRLPGPRPLAHQQPMAKRFWSREHDQHLAANRARWRTDTALIDDYRQHRPLVERTIAWLVTNGHRRMPTPRRRAQQDRVLHPSCRHQPQTPHQPRTRPRRHHLEPRPQEADPAADHPTVAELNAQLDVVHALFVVALAATRSGRLVTCRRGRW